MTENEDSPAGNSPLLDPIEARVLGCLLEKERTTPEYYPLSLNALTNACNQKSNRKPILLIEETAVREAADRLREKKLVMMFHGADARVPKFKHTVNERFQMEPPEKAVLCELLLRGPQTPGELRGRCERMHPFAHVTAVEETLTSLIDYPGAPLVARMPRQPGQKEQRYAQLLSDLPPEETASPAPQAIQSSAGQDRERLERLEEEVARLRSETDELRAELERFRRQFE